MTEQLPVYMLVQMEITDMERFFAEYVGPSGPIHERHGVEVLAATPEFKVLEGSPKNNFMVIIKFPSAEAQANWKAVVRIGHYFHCHC